MRAKQINLKGMGLSQNKILYRMAKEDLVIRVISDHDCKPEISLGDRSGDNTYETIAPKMLKSLAERRLFNCMGWMPALFVTIDTYSLKGEVLKALGKVKLLIIFSLLFCSCSVLRPKDGCPAKDYRNIQKHDSKKFRVEKITPKGGYYLVKFKQVKALQNTYQLRKYECLPDSITVGNIVEI